MSILGEILGQLLAEAVSGFGNKKPRVPFPEGEANASLGAISLFAGVLSLIFSAAALNGGVNRSNYVYMGPAVILGMAVISFLAAALAYRAGRKAPRVTRRNLGMAVAGAYLSLLAMLVSGIAALLCIVRLGQWTL